MQTMSPNATAPPPLPPKTRKKAHVVSIRVSSGQTVPQAVSAAESGCVRISVNRLPVSYYLYNGFKCADHLDNSKADYPRVSPTPPPKSTAVRVTVNGEADGKKPTNNHPLPKPPAHIPEPTNEAKNQLNTEPAQLNSEPETEPAQPNSEPETEPAQPNSEPETEPAQPNPEPETNSEPETKSQPKSDQELKNETIRALREELSKEPTSQCEQNMTKRPGSGPVLSPVKLRSSPRVPVEERTYEERKAPVAAVTYDSDHYYDFHLHEAQPTPAEAANGDEDYFAGCRSFGLQESSIRSSKGTIRGVKNRVRAGVATFLQMQSTQPFAAKEAGQVVVYTTTMGIVRATAQRCARVRQILRTLLVRFEERDLFMARDAQAELQSRLGITGFPHLPQVFVEGRHLGDAETIERLNESGELRKMLKTYKSPDAATPCEVCGGYRLLPCAVCNGSKKSVHRNHFTAELVALRCMNCDEVGLVRCYAC